MNRIRVIVAGIVGGLVMFFGGFVMHAVVQTDNMFMQDLPSERVVVDPIRDTLRQRGYYTFPARKALQATEAGRKELHEKMAKEPSGIIIYNPDGITMWPAMATELVSNVALCIILSAVLARVSGSKPTRIALAALLGVAAWMAIDVSYWTWYKYPDTFVLAGLIEQAGCWFLSGTAITLVLGKHMIAAPIGHV